MSQTPTEQTRTEAASRFVPDSRQSAKAAAENEAVIFLHLPKTAGTTLNRLIEWEYPLSKMYSVDPVLFEWSAARLRNFPPERLRRIRMFKGHMTFGLHELLPQPATYISVLREPVDRVISAFYFMRSYKLHPLYWKFRRGNWTLEDFVRWSRRENVQSKIIAGAEYEEPCTAEIAARAQKNLAQHFAVVGLSERFEESLALMKLRFGWRLNTYSSFNVTRARPKKHDLPTSLIDLISEKNSFDMELYRCAQGILAEAIERNAEKVATIAHDLKVARARTGNSIGSTIFSIRAATRKAVSRAYSSI